MIAETMIDGLLAVMIIWLGWRAQASPERFGAALCFIVLGLLTVLAWFRLGAPDVALAEAAVGAGLTGVLLLGALAAPRTGPRPHVRQGFAQWALAVTAIAGAAVIAALATRPAAPGLQAAVERHMSETGVSSPVTAILLSFRAYDTLLEVAVLVLAALVGWSFAAERTAAGGAVRRDPMLDAFARRLVLVGVLVAGYLWWAGTSQPGGAFQAGTVLGVTWVFLTVTGFGTGPSPSRWYGRVAVLAGLALFLAIGLSGLRISGAFLAYPPGWSKALILTIEAGLTATIASCLVVLVTSVMDAAQRSEDPG